MLNAAMRPLVPELAGWRAGRERCSYSDCVHTPNSPQTFDGVLGITVLCFGIIFHFREQSNKLNGGMFYVNISDIKHSFYQL